MNPDVETSFERYLSWCKNQALPLWIDRGISEDGGFWERLDHDGKPVRNLNQRVYVQCRQCLVLSEAAARNWHPSAKSLAIKSLKRIVSQLGFSTFGHPEFTGVPYSWSPDGTVQDGRSDLYTYGFVLLALAQYAKLVDNEKGIACAEEVMCFLDLNMASNHDGWIESIPEILPRRQNPHMHLFEAMLAMYDCTGLDCFRYYAEGLISLFQRRFLPPKKPYRLLEFFNSDWSVDDQTGHLVEPGHMFEWVWLLNWYERVSGWKPAVDVDELFSDATKIGLTEDRSTVINTVDIHGKLVDGGSRYWPQTEAIKAALVLAERGNDMSLAIANSLVNNLLDKFLGAYAPIRGGWVDGFDRDGKPLDNYNSASAFYHYVGVATELEYFLSTQEKSL